MHAVHVVHVVHVVYVVHVVRSTWYHGGKYPALQVHHLIEQNSHSTQVIIYKVVTTSPLDK